MKKSILSGIMAVAFLSSVTVMAQEVNPKGKQEVKKEAPVVKKEAPAVKKEEKKEVHKKSEAAPKKEHTEKAKSTGKEKK